MQPCKYEKVASCETALQIKPGFAVHLQEENANVDAWTDINLQNPGFATTFKLPPGKVDLKVADGKIAALAIKPDLKSYNAELNINPLKDGSFKFSICRKLEQIKSGIKLEYCSECSEGKVTLTPKFNYKGVKIDGQFAFNGVKEGQPIILVDHLKAKFNKFALCSCYNLPEKEARAAVFVNLNKAKAGTLLHFNKDFVLKEADVFAKTKVKGLKISAIAKVLEAKQYTVKLQKKCPVSNASMGAMVKYTAKQIDFAAGLITPVKCADLKLVLNGKKTDAINAGINALFKFPIKDLGKAQVGVAIPNLTAPTQLGYNFEITFKH